MNKKTQTPDLNAVSNDNWDYSGFDFDDVLYLFAPVVWLNLHLPFLIGASVGAPAFALLTWLRFKKLKAK